MKTFNVIVTRDTTESTTVTLDAPDGQAAIDAALELVRMDPNDLSWAQDDTPNASSDPYVTDVSEQ